MSSFVKKSCKLLLLVVVVARGAAAEVALVTTTTTSARTGDGLTTAGSTLTTNSNIGAAATAADITMTTTEEDNNDDDGDGGTSSLLSVPSHHEKKKTTTTTTINTKASSSSCAENDNENNDDDPTLLYTQDREPVVVAADRVVAAPRRLQPPPGGGGGGGGGGGDRPPPGGESDHGDPDHGGDHDSHDRDRTPKSGGICIPEGPDRYNCTLHDVLMGSDENGYDVVLAEIHANLTCQGSFDSLTTVDGTSPPKAPRRSDTCTCIGADVLLTPISFDGTTDGGNNPRRQCQCSYCMDGFGYKFYSLDCRNGNSFTTATGEEVSTVDCNGVRNGKCFQDCEMSGSLPECETLCQPDQDLVPPPTQEDICSDMGSGRYTCEASPQFYDRDGNYVETSVTYGCLRKGYSAATTSLPMSSPFDPRADYDQDCTCQASVRSAAESGVLSKQCECSVCGPNFGERTIAFDCRNNVEDPFLFGPCETLDCAGNCNGNCFGDCDLSSEFEEECRSLCHPAAAEEEVDVEEIPPSNAPTEDIFSISPTLLPETTQAVTTEPPQRPTSLSPSSMQSSLPSIIITTTTTKLKTLSPSDPASVAASSSKPTAAKTDAPIDNSPLPTLSTTTVPPSNTVDDSSTTAAPSDNSRLQSSLTMTATTILPSTVSPAVIESLPVQNVAVEGRIVLRGVTGGLLSVDSATRWKDVTATFVQKWIEKQGYSPTELASLRVKVDIVSQRVVGRSSPAALTTAAATTTATTGRQGGQRRSLEGSADRGIIMAEQPVSGDHGEKHHNENRLGRRLQEQQQQQDGGAGGEDVEINFRVSVSYQSTSSELDPTEWIDSAFNTEENEAAYIRELQNTEDAELSNVQGASLDSNSLQVVVASSSDEEEAVVADEEVSRTMTAGPTHAPWATASSSGGFCRAILLFLPMLAMFFVPLLLLLR